MNISPQFQSFLSLGFGLAAGTAFTNLVSEAHSLGVITSFIKKAARRFEDKVGIDSFRKKCLSNIFGLSGRNFLCGSNMHYDPPLDYSDGECYPHDMHVMKAMCLLLKGNIPELHASLIDEPWLDADSLVCSGSPATNKLVREYLPLANFKKQGANTNIIDSTSLRYHFAIGEQKTIRVKSAMHSNKEIRKLNHAIFDKMNGSIWRPFKHYDSGGWLQNDFLLITKLPRNRQGGDILLLSGGHGAGTQAFELLFDPKAFPLSELEKLISLKESYFQILLEASEIQHNQSGSVATKLKISEACPPYKITGGTSILL
jgi:hypothetical protein